MRHHDPTGHDRFERLLVAWQTGLLDEADDRWMRAHADACEACRALDDRDDRDDRDHDDEGGERHLPPAMIATWDRARTELRGMERRAVARHLARCASCREELAFLGHAPTLEDVSPTAATAPGAAVPEWVRKLGAVAERLADLVTPVPLPVQVMRSAPTDPADVARARGIEAYASGAFADAEPFLAEAARAKGDAETWLLAGSARLLGGDAAGAVPAFRSAVEGDASEAIADEARWHLAVALVTAGSGRAAVGILESLRAGTGRRSSDAGELLASLERVVDGDV